MIIMVFRLGMITVVGVLMVVNVKPDSWRFLMPYPQEQTIFDGDTSTPSFGVEGIHDESHLRMRRVLTKIILGIIMITPAIIVALVALVVHDWRQWLGIQGK